MRILAHSIPFIPRPKMLRSTCKNCSGLRLSNSKQSVVFQPTYAACLNPIEPGWRNVRSLLCKCETLGWFIVLDSVVQHKHRNIFDDEFTFYPDRHKVTYNKYNGS